MHDVTEFARGATLAWCAGCGRISDITAPDRCLTCGASFAPRVIGTVTKVDRSELTITVGSDEQPKLAATGDPRNRAERRARRRA